MYVFETKIDTGCPNINYIDYIRKNINLYIKVLVIFGTLIGVNVFKLIL